MNKTVKVEFKPFKRDDGKYAYQILTDGNLRGYVHWIESTNGKICTIGRPDMVMSPVWSIEQAENDCAWLNQAYIEGKIKICYYMLTNCLKILPFVDETRVRSLKAYVYDSWKI